MKKWLLKRFLKWLGISSRPDFNQLIPDMDAKQQSTDLVNSIWRIHAALDTVYGKGYAKENPLIVAQFMQASSTQTLAAELAALREIIASGTGGLTVGIENLDMAARA